jgi:hypothetical protein
MFIIIQIGAQRREHPEHVMLARYHMPGQFMILSIGANPQRLGGDTCSRLAVRLRTGLIYSISQVLSNNLALRQLIRDAYCRLATKTYKVIRAHSSDFQIWFSNS